MIRQLEHNSRGIERRPWLKEVFGGVPSSALRLARAWPLGFFASVVTASALEMAGRSPTIVHGGLAAAATLAALAGYFAPIPRNFRR